MIRPYQDGDEKSLDPNDFSKTDIVDYNNKICEMFTQKEGEETKSIMFWKEYEPKKYGAFFLMGKNITRSNAKELKKFVKQSIIDYKPLSCLTYSIDCDILNKWHYFLGFTTDKRDQVLIDGVIHNKWVIKWVGKH